MMVLIMLFLMCALCCALLVVTPQLMPANECFAVTVPEGSRNEEPLSGYMRAYRRLMVLCSVLCLAAWPLVIGIARFDVGSPAGTMVIAFLTTVTMGFPIVLSFALMLHYRKRVRAVKQARGWSASTVRSAAYVGPEDFPQPISVAWNLLYIPLVALMVVAALALYDQFPETIPMHADFNGTVNEYARKTLGAVLFPAVLTGFIGLIMAACHLGIVHSKRPIDPDAPASSALAYGRFARLQSIVMFVGGMGLTATVGVAFFLSSLGAITLGTAGVIVTIAAVAFAIAMTVVALKLGQSGARDKATLANSGSRGKNDGRIAFDDDAHWPLGIFYFNREEPSVFVPKRFGIGWTLNMARPATWVVIGAFVLALVVFALGVNASVS